MSKNDETFIRKVFKKYGDNIKKHYQEAIPPQVAFIIAFGNKEQVKKIKKQLETA